MEGSTKPLVYLSLEGPSVSPATSSFVVFLCIVCITTLPAEGSYAVYVGKNLTADGSVFLGGTGDEVSSHWLEIVAARSHPPGSALRVGVDSSAVIPGEMIEIPQTEHTLKYITMNYSDYEGFPPPLTNGGLNERHVAARDVWSPSRPELVKMTPNPQRGPNYSDLSRIVMERANNAREAVEIVGTLIDEYGYSTYGGNSHLFADSNEGWVLIAFAGGQGLWIAVRLAGDDIRMLYPGYILEIPLNYRANPDYMGSRNFISFAVEQGWYDASSGEPFNVNDIYGSGRGRSEISQLIENRLRAMAPVTLREILNTIRDPLISTDSNGYGQLARLRSGVHTDLGELWIAPTGSVTSPFIPYRIGVSYVPAEFGKHRYLTKGEATRFVSPDWQIQEASRFAYRMFKRLMYFTCDHPEKFLPEVQEAFTAFEDQLISDQTSVEATALQLYGAGENDLAREYLTSYSNQKGMDALQLGEALLASIEARTRVLFGFREPKTREMSRRDGPIVNCRIPCQEASLP
jgi:dipeptidase